MHLDAASLESSKTITHPPTNYDVRRVPPSYSLDVLFTFNKTHGTTPHNHIPDGPVREHLKKIATGKAFAWGAFSQSNSSLMGFVTLEPGGEYWSEVGTSRQRHDATGFIHEFVVDPAHRGRGCGTRILAAAVATASRSDGIFDLMARMDTVYTTVHQDNVGSRTAFIKAGFVEVVTYVDAARSRNTTVLKFEKTFLQ